MKSVITSAIVIVTYTRGLVNIIRFKLPFIAAALLTLKINFPFTVVFLSGITFYEKTHVCVRLSEIFNKPAHSGAEQKKLLKPISSLQYSPYLLRLNPHFSTATDPIQNYPNIQFPVERFVNSKTNFIY